VPNPLVKKNLIIEYQDSTRQRREEANNYKPANIPTKYWLTPSGVKTPTSENTSEIKSGLSEMVVKRDVKKGKASQT
jgi:hypothetical protein